MLPLWNGLGRTSLTTPLQLSVCCELEMARICTKIKPRPLFFIFLYCISFWNAQLLVHADFKLSAVLSGASYLFYLCHYRLWATFESLRRRSTQTVIPLQWQEDCFKESSRAELWTFLCCLCEGMYHSKDAQEVRFYLSFAQIAHRVKVFCMLIVIK